MVEGLASTPTKDNHGVSGWWRAATIACLVVLSIGLAAGVSVFEQFKAQVQHLQAMIKDTAQVKYIAVLTDSQGVPAMLITMAQQDNALQLQRLNGVTEGRDDAMQLWALSEGDPTRSLGILESKGKTLRLPATERDLASAATLAISVESKSAARQAQGPSLPFLFRGSVIQKAL
jgi:anti-sigma-K factor RskA